MEWLAPDGWAEGSTLPCADAPEVFFPPPAYALPNYSGKEPPTRDEISHYQRVWVEPISRDTTLRDELRGWYRVKDRYVGNEAGRRFYLDFYESKWVAFAEEE